MTFEAYIQLDNQIKIETFKENNIDNILKEKIKKIKICQNSFLHNGVWYISFVLVLSIMMMTTINRFPCCRVNGSKNRVFRGYIIR